MPRNSVDRLTDQLHMTLIVLNGLQNLKRNEQTNVHGGDTTDLPVLLTKPEQVLCKVAKI